MNTLEVLILIIQVIIVALQLWLSYRINQQDLSKNKGFFIPGNTNIKCPREIEAQYFRRYDLKKSFPFDLVGNDAVNISSYRIEADNNLLIDTSGNYNPVFFVKERDLSIFECKFPLSEEQLRKEELSITISLRLENTSGFRYTERLFIGLQRIDQNEYWDLRSLNLSFLRRW